MKICNFLLMKFFFLVRIIVDKISDILFGLYWRQTTPLPPIQNPLLLMSAQHLAEQIRKRQISSEAVIRAFVDRLQQVNSTLNAIVDERFQAAFQEAVAVDEFIATGEKSEDELRRDTPFLGVPFSVKDHIAVEGLRLTLGLKSRRNTISDSDSEVVSLMRRAGAIPIISTNTPELCLNWADCTNPVTGTTVNAYNSTRVSGGSSGGEGSLLGAAASVIGIGSDFGGSIRFPSMFNGVYGHKSTWGLLSQEGVLPKMEPTLAQYFTTGPMCRYASDLRPMLKVMAGANAEKLHLDENVQLKDIKFYYMEDIGGCPIVSKVDSEIKAAQRQVIRYLDQKYGIKAQKIRMPRLKYSLAIIANSMWKQKEVKIKTIVADYKREMNIYWELLKWLFFCSPHSISLLFLILMDEIFPKPLKTFTAPLLWSRDALQREFLNLLGDDGVFLYPTHPTTAIHHSQALLQTFNFIYCAIFNVTGLPATHCTLGLSKEGLPLGIQVAASHYNDHLCLTVAEELERAFGGWISPPSGMPKPVLV